MVMPSCFAIFKSFLTLISFTGGGPYSCAVDYSANGQNFEPVEMLVNLPGQNGRSDARAVDLPIEVKMPAGAKCKGGADGQTCIVRCLNVSPLLLSSIFKTQLTIFVRRHQGAKAGPFGGCMAFTQKQGLFVDPAPSGKGPSPGAWMDPITLNPVTRYGDLFDTDNANLRRTLYSLRHIDSMH